MLAQILGSVLISIGVFFSIVGIIGIIRFPDVYCRIHASGKVSSLGILGLLLGAAVLMPEIALKALALGFFMVITAPAASHTIALAAHRQGIQPVEAPSDNSPAKQPAQE